MSQSPGKWNFIKHFEHGIIWFAQRGFAAILLLMLGLELLDSLRTYYTEHRVRLEMILIVAMIALGRHVILLDVEHLDALQQLGISALALALTTGYFLVKRSGQLQTASPMKA